MLDISRETQTALQWNLIPQKNSLVLPIGLFKTDLATLTKFFCVRFNPKFFGRKLKPCSVEFLIPHTFLCCAQSLKTCTWNWETNTHKTFDMVPKVDNMRSSNIERQNTDILHSVIYKESVCLISIQKHKICFKNCVFSHQKVECQTNISSWGRNYVFCGRNWTKFVLLLQFFRC